MRRTITIITTLLLLFLMGCSKDKDVNSATEEDSNKLTPKAMDTSGMDEEKIDINKDGKIDQHIYTQKGVIQYATRDFNFDGITDMTEFYEDGVHTRDEIDLDYDGIYDVIITYQSGIPVKKDFSIDFQGNRHGTQYFDAQGNRTEIHRDTDGDGNLDIIEYYRPGETEPYKTTQKGIQTDHE